MMQIQSETNGRPQPMPRAQTGPFKNQLVEARANLITAVLAGQSSHVQGENVPLRYRLLTDTALRLADLNQIAAYFDLSDLAYQYDLATWVQNSIRLLAIQLNLPLPTASWWTEHSETDPIAVFIQFLEENGLGQADKPVLLSFDEADRLLRAPLANDFWRLLKQIGLAQKERRGFAQLTLVLWGQVSWQQLTENGRFLTTPFKQIIL